MEKAEVQARIRSPENFYGAPLEVVRDGDLTQAQKIAVLRSMEQNALLLAVAAEENMGGGEASNIEEIIDGIRQVDPKALEEEEHRQGTKY